MGPIENGTTKNSKRGGKNSRTIAKRQERKSVTNDSDEEEEDIEDTNFLAEDKMDNYIVKAMDNPLKFKLCLKADSDKLEGFVQKCFGSDTSDEEIFTLPSKDPGLKQMSQSMQNLDISNKATKSKNSAMNWTPVKKTRQSAKSSQIETHLITPSRTRSGRTSNSEKSQTPSGRSLRDRKEINYRDMDDMDLPTRTKSQSQKRNERQEPNENESIQTPKKRQMTRRMSERQPLNSVDENQSYKPPDEESPKSQQKTRGRKINTDLDSDGSYEGTPSKRKNVSLPLRRKTPTRRQTLTPARRKLMSDEKNIEGTPRSRVMTRRSLAVTPKSLAVTPRSRAITPKSRAVTPKSGAMTPKSLLMTPKGRRTLTPSMHMRNASVAKPRTNLQEFRTRLHVSFVPKSLPCREVEFNDIFTFLKGKLTEEIGGCIYISGVPGTGKTATVNEVISCLKKLESKGELPAFEFIDINGMKLTEPRQAYVQIKKKLTGIASSWEESHRYLHHRFTTPASHRNMTLLLIDEMDLLCTKRQDVVYNLLDWPTHKASHLVVITIANTMDLPERVLMGRVSSRLGLTRLTFSPYNHMQLMEIVKTRLKDMEGFKPEAIQLVARKVASVSGDARRALDICRRATEIAESCNRDFVSIIDVTSALNEMIANPRVQAIQCCSTMERLFLEAICQEVARTGIEQVTLKNIYAQFEAICILEGEEVPNVTQTLEICRKLASWRLILWESGADLYQSVLLNVTNDDIYFSKKKVS